ncbi:Subtilase [Parasponia andersonii]|uniref:Subtilase n=1 Tax=Parasponia andersonii TaxID=3476 RepID=A0A2P5AMH6_PARAD|nr:Subtilase [Parasponia andersonii]
MATRNLKCARKNHLLVVLALFFFQHLFHVSFKHVLAKSNVYIVYLGGKKHDEAEANKKLHHKLLSNLLGSKEVAKRSIVYSYRHGFSGFAARLTEAEAESMAEFPEVVQVIPNRIHKLHTTRSWDFIGIRHNSQKNDSTENTGKGTIIGVIDSGIWPESESFNDKGMPPIPSHWRGVCQQGEEFKFTNCNRKIIGARWFIKGLMAEMKRPINITDTGEYLSPRDGNGHGTHTASTAAGYFVKQASYKGLAAGLARGGAPLAHLAIYKACWGAGGCTNADLLKAFDKAIHDGVDILSISVGNEVPLFSYVDNRDTIAIGSFHATAKGITVVSSAGNDGPTSQTISNTAPWLITVAATTIDRAFPTAITLGNNQTLWGQSIDTRTHNHRFAGITYSERIAVDSTDASSKDCEFGSLNATLAAGKIVVCFSNLNDQQDIASASTAVKEAGGVGVILAQFHSDGLQSCDIPCVKVDYEVGTQILSYIRRARSPTAKLSSPNTVIGKWMSPRVASFSSRGPSSLTPAVLKPDVAAPGVDILAAFPPSVSKPRNGYYQLLSGTSMACPHVAGIAALIKSLHRNWSPAAIRSALVTTASQTGTDGTDISSEGPNRKTADPFDIGGGHVNPIRAMDPGLIFDVSTQDYIQYLCSLGYKSSSITRLTETQIACGRKRHAGLNLNLPSITIPNLKRTTSVTVTRTVTNVGRFDSVYEAIVSAPSGVEMRVVPQVLRFNTTTRSMSFKVSFFSAQRVHGDYKFGSLTWVDGKHRVRSPVAVRVIRFEAYADV